MNHLKFVYFGRLDYEKGFDEIIELIQNLNSSNLEKIVTIYIFGDGEYRQLLEDEISTITNKYLYVRYFGWVSKELINKYLDESHFCLMPSRFLETFWLSALEAMEFGLPVIWPQKWSLKRFVFDEFNTQNHLNLSELIFKIVEDIDSIDYEWFSSKSVEISGIFTISKWIENFWKIDKYHRWKKILLVSDYITNIWWIEKYIYDIRDILKTIWYNVELFWWDIESGSKKKFWLFATALNIPYYLKLKKVLQQYDPDVIRFHSLVRFLGWLPFSLVQNSNAIKMIMYHDFWYFHPYPSKIYDEKQLEDEFSLVWFIKQANLKFWILLPVKFILVLFKFISLRLIKNYIIKNIDVNLVPSDYMVDIVKDKYWQDLNVLELPHFKK